MSGAPKINRDAMAAVAPDGEAALLDAASELLAPLHRMLDGVDLAALDGLAPAVDFAPTGPGEWRRPALPPPPAGTPAAAVPDRPAGGELAWTPAADLAALVRGGTVAAGEVAAAYAERIARLDPRLGAFITVTLDRAAVAPDVAANGRLAGVPVGLKDIIDTAGITTTCGSRVFAERVPDADAAVWSRLRAAGAVLAGKTGTHEFAAGATSENDHFGQVRNPWDPSRVSGGSSGGSGAAVAAAMVAAALGSDTGGSVRIPAACCGIVGLKPTFATVPTAGVYPLSWTLDTVGPLARTVRDAALLHDVLAGGSAEDAARAGAASDLTGLRVGVPWGWLADAHPAVAARFEEAVADLRRCGAETVEVATPDLDTMVEVTRVIQYAEASARHEDLLRTRPDYGPAIRARKEAGRYVLAGEYLTAQRLRTAICRRFAAAWEGADLLAMPTLPCTAPPVGATTVDLAGSAAGAGAALVRFTVPLNLTGLPAISVPCGFGGDGLPVGLQLAAPPHEEDLLCFAAAVYEAATGWHRERPALAA